MQSSGQSHLQEGISADMAVQPSTSNAEAADALRLRDRCSQLTKQLHCCWYVKEMFNTKLSTEMYLQSLEQQVLSVPLDKTDVSIIDRFTFATRKKGQRQNFTGLKFHHDAVSRRLLGTTETSVKNVPVISSGHLM